MPFYSYSKKLFRDSSRSIFFKMIMHFERRCSGCECTPLEKEAMGSEGESDRKKEREREREREREKEGKPSKRLIENCNPKRIPCSKKHRGTGQK